MLCDLPILGSILVDEEYIFFPSVIMQQEALVPSAGEPPGDFPRKKLSLDKVAENAQIGVDQATAILDQIVKKIVSVILSSYFFSLGVIYQKWIKCGHRFWVATRDIHDDISTGNSLCGEDSDI